MWKPTALVLGPGGIKTLPYIKSLSVLQQHGILTDVTTIAGVSAGSIIGCLLAVGYTPIEILSIALNSQLLNTNINFDSIRTLLTEIKNKLSLVDLTPLKNKLTELIITKCGTIPTFEELFTSTGVRFIVVCHNITQRKVEYFDKKTHPDCSIIDAVIGSCSIPGVTGIWKYKGCIYADGAISDPCPVKCVGIQRGTLVFTVSDCYKDTNIVDILKLFFDSSMLHIKSKSIDEAGTEVHFIDIKLETNDWLKLTLSDQEKQNYCRIGETEIEPHLELFLSGRHMSRFDPANESLLE